ncbi:unnamed protein product [Peniophora sp. CBMAI 1063]|nr:unnamed protein product [Peniophora sp. CBMAI 1063]
MSMFILILELAFAPALLALAFLLFNVVRGIFARVTKYAMLRKVNGPGNQSFVAGNLQDLYSHGGLAHLEALSQYGRVVKVHGLFGDTLLSISDPRSLTHVLINSAQNFQSIDTSGTLDMHKYFTGRGLLSTTGPEHRRQRKLLNPVFSHAHMRRVSPLMRDIARQLKELIVSEVEKGAGDSKPRVCELDCAEYLGRAALEYIAQVGFGHTFHAMEGGADKYVHAIKDLIPNQSALGAYIPIFVLSGASRLPPKMLRLLGNLASLFSSAIRHIMLNRDVMHDEMRAIWKARKAARVDGDQEELLGALLEANEEGQVSDEEMSDQASTLLLAGAETSSTALCRILHLLALHPDIQDRLRQEMVQARASVTDGSDQLDYDALMALPFLDAVCKETLRVFAPAPLRNRRCIKENTIPFSDGRSVRVPSGTEILVNVHGMNTDTELWGPDAKTWKPERWLKRDSQSADAPGVYANMLTFLAGPKSCIGMNFSILEIKIVISTLITSMAFKPPSSLEIQWRFGETITPGVKGEKSVEPKMPLRVELL